MSDFVHLHVHTTYSLLDGQCLIKPLVRRARELGMKALAVTDHGNLFALKAFHAECLSTKAKDYGDLPPIKPILGCEAYIVRGDRRERVKRERFHLCLHALNMTGYRNLVRIISEAHISGFYYKPCIDRELLEKHHEGLHCSSACLAGEISSAITAGRTDEAEATAKWYKDLFGDDYSLEIMLHKSAVHPEMNAAPNGVWHRQKETVRGVLELAKKLDIRVVATNDVHFLDKDDNDSHDVLLALSTGKKMSDPPRIDGGEGDTVRGGRLVYTGEEWFKTEEDMARLFAECPETVRATAGVAERVEQFSLDSPPIMPKFPIPPEFGSETDPKYASIGNPTKARIALEADYLEKLVREGALERWGGKKGELSAEIAERLDYELSTIRKMGFPGYFLIVQDYIAQARKMGVWVGPGRGSAAGAAVAYALRITNVDPLKFGLLFERFLNPDRISMPDIDVDFDDAGRGRVLEYVTAKYGKDHVAHIVTFGQMAPKSAIKDVGRVMDYPLPDTNRLAALVPEAPKITFNDAIANSPELKAACENTSDATVHQLLERARHLDGCVRQPGVHACGIIISRDPLVDTIPVMPTENEDLLTTQYDGHFVESVGLLKMDFLGLKTLTVEKECVALIKQFHGVDVNPDEIRDDDADTYGLFSRGETTGLFQFESEGMKSNLRLLKPDRLEDLVAMNALYRPGPMAYIPNFINRKHGREPITYDHPLMECYLKDTYGITVYQEQVMLLSRLLGNFTRGESDKLRKAMGKKQIAVMEELKAKFTEGCLKNPQFRVDKWEDEKEALALIDKIWGDWRAFAEYAFNKSHAVCYAWIAYQTGYLKQHYPAEFMCAQISSEIGNFDKLPGFVAEAGAMGLEIKPPDVNSAYARFTPVAGEKAIRYGLAGVRGVGEGAAEAIVKEREANGPYKGLMDFCMRLAGEQAVSRRTVESLAKCGAFDSLGLHRAKAYNNAEYAVRQAQKRNRERANGQTDMFSVLMPDMDTSDKELADCPAWPAAECYKAERDFLGIYMTGHPLGAYERAIESVATFRLEEMGRAGKGFHRDVRVAGMLSECRIRIPKHDPARPKKNLNPWALIRIDDGSAEVEAFVFSRVLEKYQWLRDAADTAVLLCGEISHRMIKNREDPSQPPEEGDLQFIVKEAYRLEEGVRRFSKAIVVERRFEDPSLVDTARAVNALAERHPGQVPWRMDLDCGGGHVLTVDMGDVCVAPTGEFFAELDRTVSRQSWRIAARDEIYLAPPEPKPWERQR